MMNSARFTTSQRSGSRVNISLMTEVSRHSNSGRQPHSKVWIDRLKTSLARGRAPAKRSRSSIWERIDLLHRMQWNRTHIHWEAPVRHRSLCLRLNSNRLVCWKQIWATNLHKSTSDRYKLRVRGRARVLTISCLLKTAPSQCLFLHNFTWSQPITQSRTSLMTQTLPNIPSSTSMMSRQ